LICRGYIFGAQGKISTATVTFKKYLRYSDTSAIADIAEKAEDADTLDGSFILILLIPPAYQNRF